MGSADESPSGGLGLERLIRLHIKALSDFLREVYPAANTDRYIETTFEETQLIGSVESQRTIRLMLFAECRRHLLRGRPASWMRRNLMLVSQQINAQAHQMSTPEARADTVRVAIAFSTLGEAEQEAVLIANALDDCSDAELAVVLASASEDAAERLARARRALERAYNDSARVASPEGEHQ